MNKQLENETLHAMHLLNINHSKKARALSLPVSLSLVGRGDLAEKLPSKSFGTIHRMRRLLFDFGSGLDPIKRLRESRVCLTASDFGRGRDIGHAVQYISIFSI